MNVLLHVRFEVLIVLFLRIQLSWGHDAVFLGE